MKEKIDKVSQDMERISFFTRLKTALKQYPVIYSRLVFMKRKVVDFLSLIRWVIYKHIVKFNRNGLNATEQRPHRIIASLTSYPARIKFVPYVVASLLNQTMKPDKIILWLAESQFPDKKLPPIFDEVTACGVEVKFCQENLKPHTKYFYVMQEYPEDLIITFDDDFIYRDITIETLYKSYLEHPECVSAMRVIALNPDRESSLSQLWYFEPGNVKGHESYSFFATGVSGVLYPPHCLPAETFNSDAFMKLCPNADDTWLRIMEIMNGTKVVSAFKHNKVQGLSIIVSQKDALYKSNVHGRHDLVQLQNILEAYSDWRDSNGHTLFEVLSGD